MAINYHPDKNKDNGKQPKQSSRKLLKRMRLSRTLINELHTIQMAKKEYVSKRLEVVSKDSTMVLEA